MATQEERLQIVEFDLKHFKTETIKAYGDMAMELVMVKGLTEDAVKRLIGVKRTLDEHTVLLTNQSERLDGFDQRLDTMSQRMETGFEEQGKKLDQIMLLLNTLTTKPE
ncbi:MAG TPA: hypothetical protein VNG51_11350 [Ktedonobacteraceae bacterium]|nr:hypothetical protein [Ktedonobacteraceae bacterium]